MKSESLRSGGPEMEIEPDAEAYLLAHRWQGNVRELDNVINRARILAENDCITVADLPAALVAAVDQERGTRHEVSGHGSLREQMQRVEREMIAAAIDQARGDRRLAAQHLGISLSSLYRKLEDAGPEAIDEHQTPGAKAG